MNYILDDLTTALREARIDKGLSQRALSKLAGLPQSHISRVEKNAVDLRASSLVTLARALDLELTLVPRKALPAVQSMVRTITEKSTGTTRQTASGRPAYRLDEDDSRD